MKAEEEWIGGVHAVTEQLQQNAAAVQEVLIARKKGDPASEQIKKIARNAGVKVRFGQRRDIDRVLDGVNHQSIAARLTAFAYQDFEDLLNAPNPPCLWVLLDEVTDPGNLGAILRSSWAFGAGAVVITKHRAAGLTATAVKTAAGAAARVPVCRVTNLKRTIEALKSKGVWIYGAAAQASEDLWTIDGDGPLALVLGSEGKGLRKGVSDACDVLFRIPMKPDAESVNVSVAAGIAMAHLFARRSE